jgi:hypothetical protein
MNRLLDVAFQLQVSPMLFLRLAREKSTIKEERK